MQKYYRRFCRNAYLKYPEKRKVYGAESPGSKIFRLIYKPFNKIIIISPLYVDFKSKWAINGKEIMEYISKIFIDKKKQHFSYKIVPDWKQA